ncbi:hypothetical protein V5799_014370, partial [Amblyomma americanum]
MADPAAYPGCVGQSMNFAEHPYDGRAPGHCQGGGGYPYPAQYRPHPSSPPASYGPPPGQHCGGGSYGNGPMPSNPGPPYPRQPYPGAVPEMRYGPPRHSAPPAYPGSPAPHAKPPGAWDLGGGGNYGARPSMMQSPPPIRSPVSSAPPLHNMGSYRTVSGHPPSPLGVGAPPPPHGNMPVPQSQSPSWSQSPRTTPSPLACHARSPAPQQPPFSPPTPAPTPQLQKPPSPMTGSHDPLQSLEKMVLLDPHGGGGGNMNYSGMQQESSGYGSTVGTESAPGSPYPTYYNLDQNRMCTPPDPGPPYGVANFAATGCYRTVLPSAESSTLRGGERTSSGISAPPPSSGVYPPPTVNGVSDSDFGTDSPLGAPQRCSDFDRPYAGPQGSPPCDDPAKRRRSSDSALCGRPSSVGSAGSSGVTSSSGSVDSGCKLRRRSVAGVPDGSSTPVPLTVASSEPSPVTQRVKTEPETTTSEPDHSVPPCEVADSASTSAPAAAAATAAVVTTAAAAVAPLQLSPTKRKRGRPFGAKNKVKDSAATVKQKRRKVAAQPAPAATLTVTSTPVAAKVRTPVMAGPYIRVVGTRERPLSSHIVNVAPRTVPEDESKRKKVSAATTRVVPQHTTGRRVAGSAAHTSTLSPHYDAVTRDPTWLCAFCQKGSHHQGLGDLYGPYPGAVVRPAEPEPVVNNHPEEALRKGRATKRKKSDSMSGTEDGPTLRRGRQ